MNIMFGKRIYSFLNKELKSGWFNEPFEILGIESPIGRFTLPYVEIFDEIILLYLDDKSEPKNENVIEITKKEFNEIINENCSKG